MVAHYSGKTVSSLNLVRRGVFFMLEWRFGLWAPKMDLNIHPQKRKYFAQLSGERSDLDMRDYKTDMHAWLIATLFDTRDFI